MVSKFRILLNSAVSLASIAVSPFRSFICAISFESTLRSLFRSKVLVNTVAVAHDACLYWLAVTFKEARLFVLMVPMALRGVCWLVSVKDGVCDPAEVRRFVVAKLFELNRDSRFVVSKPEALKFDKRLVVPKEVVEKPVVLNRDSRFVVSKFVVPKFVDSGVVLMAVGVKRSASCELLNDIGV